MNIFDLVAIPNNETTLRLFELLLFLGSSIFLTYIAVFLGSLLNAIYYHRKAWKTKDLNYFQIAKEYIHFVNTNNVALYGFGLFPFVGIAFIFVQFTPDNIKVINTLLVLAALLLGLGLFLSRIYKHFIHQAQTPEAEFTSQFYFRNFPINYVATAVLVIFVVVWTFIGAIVITTNPANYLEPLSYIEMFFSLSTIFRLLVFFLFSVLISNLGFIFFNFLSEERENQPPKFENSDKFIQNTLARSLVFAVFIPIFLLVVYALTPNTAVTFSYYFVFTISIIILLVALVLNFYSYRTLDLNFAKYSFFIFVGFMVAFVGTETFLFSTANKVQEFKIAKKYEVFHTEMLASMGRGGIEINGEEIYKAKCVACHAFDQKVVGPAHKDVLKKYGDRKADMVKFVLNPIKVDPAYPPMPNQGLKPKEAEAVVEYLYEHYGPMLK